MVKIVPFSTDRIVQVVLQLDLFSGWKEVLGRVGYLFIFHSIRFLVHFITTSITVQKLFSLLFTPPLPARVLRRTVSQSTNSRSGDVQNWRGMRLRMRFIVRKTFKSFSTEHSRDASKLLGRIEFGTEYAVLVLGHNVILKLGIFLCSTRLDEATIREWRGINSSRQGGIEKDVLINSKAIRCLALNKWGTYRYWTGYCQRRYQIWNDLSEERILVGVLLFPLV